ncbi:hypothetical protein PUN28_000764 [Cardiocondyla obscurior]|uniref:Uncharacterized protein n=1 Tax=Cardiocondyla obscurior TaxID=286306 RepID=A0AAW2H0Z8_9HYME
MTLNISVCVQKVREKKGWTGEEKTKKKKKVKASPATKCHGSFLSRVTMEARKRVLKKRRSLPSYSPSRHLTRFFKSQLVVLIERCISYRETRPARAQLEKKEKKKKKNERTKRGVSISTQFTNERHLDNIVRMVKSWKYTTRMANCSEHACFKLITDHSNRSNFRYDEQLKDKIAGKADSDNVANASLLIRKLIPNTIVANDSIVGDSNIVGSGAVAQAAPCRYATLHLVAGITVASGCWGVAASRIVI